MKKEYTITEGHNALHIRSEGQRYLRIFNAKGQLLLAHHGTDLIELEFLALPGIYILESDGTILEASAVNVEALSSRSVKVLEYTPNIARASLSILIDGMLYNQLPNELIEKNLLSIDELKAGLTAYFEQQSVQQRVLLIPDYKMIYALMGVYPANEKTSIEATVAKFQSEYVIAERQIKSARTLEEVLAVRPQFPTGLLGSVKKSASRPSQTKK